MIKVVIVDDHDLVRTGLKHILARAGDIDVIAEGADGEQAIRLYRELKPDVLLTDIGMPGLSGLEVTHRLCAGHPDARIIILTAFVQQPFPRRLLEAGAKGYLTKASAAEELIAAIRTVAAGRTYIGTDIAQQLAATLLDSVKKTSVEGLSARELEVMMLLVQGVPVREIAKAISISPKTVSTYKGRIMGKLGVKNDVELTRIAIRFGMIQDITADADEPPAMEETASAGEAAAGLPEQSAADEES